MKYEMSDEEWYLVREALRAFALSHPERAQESATLAERLLGDAWRGQAVPEAIAVAAYGVGP